MQRVLIKDGKEGDSLQVNHYQGGVSSLGINEMKENLGTAFSCFSLPKRGGEMRRLGRWAAESGIHPGSHNNL